MIPAMMAAGAGTGAAGLLIQGAGLFRDPPKVNAAKAAPTYFGGNADYQANLQSQLGQQDQQALMMADRERGMGMQARGLQQDVYGNYARMAQGEGPSVARQMAQQGANVAQQQANQTAASARGGGGNQLLAQRNAQRVGASAQMTASGQAAQLGQQEQLAAMAAMGETAGQMRAGDTQARGLSEGRAQSRNAALMGMNSDILRADTQRSLGDQNAEMLAQTENAKYKRMQTDDWMNFGKDATKAGGNLMAMGMG